MAKTVLVTGGAGYIGSHACKALSRAGYVPVTFDNLVTGWREAVQFGPFEFGDLRDSERVVQVIAHHKPVAVLHFAALSDVGESTRSPATYWDNNVIGTLRLLEAMVVAQVPHLVFSSTCAIYGDQDGVILTETSRQSPASAYAASKRAAEDMIRTFAAMPNVTLNHILFRYFNVAGADPEAQIGEYHIPETHLIPLTLDVASGRRDKLTIFGQDYPTPDGTCVRDYIHVDDVIAAHLMGLDYLIQGGASEVFNLGTSHGFSVCDVIKAVERVVEAEIRVEHGARRPGDCAALISGSTKVADILGWRPSQSTLDTMISSAWAWHLGPRYTAQ